VFGVQSNQLIEHVFGRLGEGWVFFPAQKIPVYQVVKLREMILKKHNKISRSPNQAQIHMLRVFAIGKRLDLFLTLGVYLSSKNILGRLD